MKIDLRYAVACAVVSALSASSAFAEQEGTKIITVPESSPAHETQQDRMKRCNVEAKQKELRGDERRAFMSHCLKS